METANPKKIETSTGLRKNSLQAWHVAILGMVAIGPAASVGLNFGFISTFSGKAIALVFIGAIIIMLLTANTLNQLSKKLVNAGSAYAFVTAGLGTRVGFIVGWIYVLSYLLFAAGGLAVFGGWFETYLESMLGIHINWFIFTALALISIAYSAYMGIRPSLKISAVIVFIEMSFIFLLSLWVILTGENSSEPFQVSSSATGLNGIGLAMVYGVLSMIGFETAATYSEELRDSKKNMGRALFMALLIPGLFYILAGYAMGIGYPDFSKIGEDPTPLQTLAQAFWGSTGTTLVVVAILSSIFGFSMGAFNALVRVLYSLGKSGVFPSALGKVHQQHGTPHVAIFWGIVLMILFAVPISLLVGPFNVWGYYGFFISLGLLIVYIMAHISVNVLYRRNFANEYSPVKHLLLPIAGGLALLYPLWKTVYPLPPMPYAMFPFLMLGWIIIGGILVAILSKTNPTVILAAKNIDEEPANE